MGGAAWVVPCVVGMLATAVLLGPSRLERSPSLEPSQNAVRVVTAGRELTAPSHEQVRSTTPAVDPDPDWAGPERDAVLRALALTKDARVRDVTPFAQTLCGQVQASPGQAFRRFAYARTARLGALDDGGAEFARTFADLCR